MFVVSVLQAANGLTPNSRFQSRQTHNQQRQLSAVRPLTPAGTNGHDTILRTYHYHPENNGSYLNGHLKPTSSFTSLAPHPSNDVWPIALAANGSLNDLSTTTMSSKSVSLPGRYNSRGFRDTFVSAQTPSPLASSNGHSHASNHGNHSHAGNLSHHGNHSNHGNHGNSSNLGNHSNSPGRTITVKSQADPTPKEKDKKWTFGNLFKRKQKPASSSPTPIPASALPAHLTRSDRFVNPNPIPKPARTLEFSSELSSTEEESNLTQQQPPAPAPPPLAKQNFLVRRLSKRKDKSKNADDNGFLKVPLQNGRRVGSSPDSLNTGQTPWTPWQGWETTKKTLTNNYSSSSMEGSMKNTKTAAREAIKARAVARRESFFGSSSSEEDNGSSSLQGSHSSLSSRNRRKPQSRPELVRSSPNHQDRPNGQAPPSPRWEARIVYTQETLEQEDPVVIRLPNRSHFSEVGLQMPLVIPNNSPYPPEDRTYANLPQVGQVMRGQSQSPFTVAPPPPPRNFRQPNFYRPVSCSYLDSYNKQFDDSAKHFESPNFQGSPKHFDSPKKFPENLQQQFHRSSPQNFEISAKRYESPKKQFESPVKNFENSAKHFESPVNNIESPQNNFESPGRNFENSTSFRDPYQNNRENSANHIKNSFQNPRGKFESPKHFGQDVIMEDANGYDNVSAVVQSHGIAKAIYFDQPPLPFKSPASFAPRPQPIGSFRSPSEPPEMKTPTKVKPRNAKTPGIEKYEEPTSKLGFPVRKLIAANKLPLAQSPVHLRASEFWRKKEAEVTGVSPNHNQKRFLSRIRSADSSPIPNMRNRISPNSNESISSLSSFSTEAPSPQWAINNKAASTSPNQQQFPLRPKTLILKQSPAKNPLSAVERLKVRPASQNSRTESRPESAQSQAKDSDAQTPTPGKTSGKNLEDALNELEDMYKSLKLSDEDLLDRAERRDLPTPHQELRNAPLLSSPLGSFESLASPVTTGSTPSLGSSSIFGSESKLRTRAPPLRRSGRVDTVNDDMAKRRFEHLELKANDPRNIVSQSGSYMLLSPAFSPPASPTPFDPLAFDDPDVTADDVVYRNYKRANATRIVEPQPLFGIPLGPLTAAPASDYLHSEPKEKFRPIFRHTKRPDLVKDDIAFRNLRKDLNPESANKDWTPRLFSESSLNSDVRPASNKKLRAIRSLSANISHLIPFQDSPVNNEIGKWNSFTDLHDSTTSRFLEPSWVDEIEKLQEHATSAETLAANERLIRRMQSSPNKDDSKSRRPWTDILLDSFEKEKQEIERLNAVAEKAIQEQILEESGDDADDVFAQEGSITKSTSFASACPSTLLQSPVSDLEVKPAPKRRPIRSTDTETTDEAKSPVQNLFTPLPPPRKIHHIHLDSFGQSKQNSDASSKSDEKLSYPPSPIPRKGEAELNDLIDALVRDADSCGTQTTQKSPQKSSHEFSETSGEGSHGPEITTQISKQSFEISTEYRKSSENSAKSQKSSEQVKIQKIPETSANSSQKSCETSASTQKSSETSANTQKSSETSANTQKSSETSANTQKSSETSASTSHTPGETTSKNCENRKSSISDLIDSINETLPELETALEPKDSKSSAKKPLASSALSSKSNVTNSGSKSNEPVEGGGGIGRKSNSAKAEENGEKTKSKVVLRKKTSTKASDASKVSDVNETKSKVSSSNIEELRKEKDKSSKRKSNLNRALTEEAAPVPEYLIDGDPAVRRRSRTLSRPVSQEMSSFDSSSHEDQYTSKESPGIVKPPQIPQIFQNSVDNKFLKAPPPSANKTISSKIKVFETSPKSGKSEKKDTTQVSDAEGISSIKRLLQRESKKNPSAESNFPRKSVTPAVFSNAEPVRVTGVKKSPSASAFNWSKLSNTQPSFLRKFFEKEPPKDKELVKESPEVVSKTEDEVIALNVAQKANFFMKLEHEQRFSKWRRGTDTPVITPVSEDKEIKPKQRFASQPVKTEDVELARNIRSSRQTPALRSQLENNNFDDFALGLENGGNVLGNSICPEMIAESAAVGGVAWSSKSSYTDRDDAFPTQPVFQSPGPEPSALSLKDRVIMFDRIQSRADSRPPSALKSKLGFPPPKSFTYGSNFGTFPTQTPIRTPYDYSNMENDRRSVFEEFSTPIGWLPPGTPYRNPDVFSPLSMAKRRGSTSDVELNTLRQMAQQGQFGPGFPPLFPGFKHCPPPPPPPISIPINIHQGVPPQVKNIRVKSMFLTSGGSDAETYSEDGEVSSGGQEVAEIISRSYENSPIFRKKSWKSQKKAQQSFAKEMWKRCTQQEDYNTDTNEVFYDAKSEFDEFTFQKFEAQPAVAAPPSTSNLLPILTALSSSNDELDESKSAPTKSKSFRKSLESQNVSRTTEVRVHHPDDESFRTFFKSNRSNFPPLCPTSSHFVSRPFCDAHPPNAASRKPADVTPSDAVVPQSIQSPTKEDSFGSVKRESELLVMKKNMPLVRRKSSGKSKNPLKALAARMDFRNQKYTESHQRRSASKDPDESA